MGKYPEIARIRRIVRQNWDEIGIAAGLGQFAASDASDELDPKYGYVVEALRRSRTDLHGADLSTLREYVHSLHEDQIHGLVNNIKGIAHEVYFVEAENHDGDPVHAYMFTDTNHPHYDVTLVNHATGEHIDLQLKASDAHAYVDHAVHDVGHDHVVVTSEMAERMGLHSSGISNHHLTADVEQVVDKLEHDQSLWHYVPGMTAWSVALVIASLARRYARGEISRNRFLTMVGAFAGAKAIKIALIVAALSVPGLNVVVGALLFLKMASSVREAYAAKAVGRAD